MVKLAYEVSWCISIMAGLTSKNRFVEGVGKNETNKKEKMVIIFLLN